MNHNQYATIDDGSCEYLGDVIAGQWHVYETYLNLQTSSIQDTNYFVTVNGISGTSIFRVLNFGFVPYNLESVNGLMASMVTIDNDKLLMIDETVVGYYNNITMTNDSTTIVNNGVVGYNTFYNDHHFRLCYLVEDYQGDSYLCYSLFYR